MFLKWDKVEKWLDFQVLANQYNLTYGEIRESFYKDGLKERYNVKVLEGDLDYATSI